MDTGKKISVVFCTCPLEHAERLASHLVESSRAACINILPQVTSIYRWEGKINRDSESLLVIKCATETVPELTAALTREHPYDVPEVIALPVEGGNADYLRWVLEESS